MPHSKRSSGRGKGRAAARAAFHGGLRSTGNASHVGEHFVPFSGTSAAKRGQLSYTLQDEARNTERHHSWSSDQKLRHTRVNFISAGELMPVQPQTTESAMAEMSLQSPAQESISIEIDGDHSGEDELCTDSPLSSADSTAEELRVAYNGPSFIIDSVGGEAVATGFPTPQVRASSPTPSNSSEEIILFTGRGRGPRASSKRSITKISPDISFDARIKIVEDKIHEQQELLEETLHDKHKYESLQKTGLNLSNSNANLCFPAVPSTRHAGPVSRNKTHRSRRGKRSARDVCEDSILADYIANMEDDEDDQEEDALAATATLQQRELGGTGSDIWLDATDDDEDDSDQGDLGRQLDLQQDLTGHWDRSDICDLDDLSTSDSVMGLVQAVLSKRERQSGIQYLVVWEQQTVDEARWVPESTLITAGATSLLDIFEAEEKFIAEFANGANEDSSDDTDDMELGGEAADDDADLIQRRIDRMTDEQIARLLAKQEQLGMGSDELVLFDSVAGAEVDHSLLPRPGFAWTEAKHRNRVQKKTAKHSRPEFPAASGLADAYEGFDIMDFERPSLKKKPKGRKGRLILDDISDSELETSMHMAWENDRVKKKERKQEREELRAQGLLGSKNGKPNMKDKYKEGMGIEVVKEEFKSFLMGTQHSLSLPPMDKGARKIIHELANAFKLKSKSMGSGNKRYPVLIRTSRTEIFVEKTYAMVEARLNRRFLPRMDIAKRAGGYGKKSHRDGGNNVGVVSYRDGDVVGASAPELGIENKGRAMLEKMGWSSGTALGAINNKGILQPVSHVVKTSKAGLG